MVVAGPALRVTLDRRSAERQAGCPGAPQGACKTAADRLSCCQRGHARGPRASPARAGARPNLRFRGDRDPPHVPGRSRLCGRGLDGAVRRRVLRHLLGLAHARVPVDRDRHPGRRRPRAAWRARSGHAPRTRGVRLLERALCTSHMAPRPSTAPACRAPRCQAPAAARWKCRPRSAVSSRTPPTISESSPPTQPAPATAPTGHSRL